MIRRLVRRIDPDCIDPFDPIVADFLRRRLCRGMFPNVPWRNLMKSDDSPAANGRDPKALNDPSELVPLVAPPGNGTAATNGRTSEAMAELPDLVTLDQAAAAVHRKKRTLERRKTNGKLPPPSVEGGGGKPDLWDWSTLRPWLTKEFGVVLPERYPAIR